MTDQNESLTTLEEIETCCQALDDKKAADMRVLYLGPKSTVTDYYIIASGTSTPHLKAMGEEVKKVLKESGISIIGMDVNPDSGWLVVDVHDFMIHLFTVEQREFYNLETLWKDATELSLKHEGKKVLKLEG